MRCSVNGGLGANDRPDPNLVFERIVSIRNGARRKIIASEGTQYSAGGWADAQNDDVDAGPGGGGSGYVTVQDHGSALPSRTVLNVTGAASVTDIGGLTTLNIPTQAPNGTAAGQTQVWNGTAWTAGALDLADVDAVQGTLPATRGGTGISGAGGVANRVLTTLNGSTWTAGLVALATMVTGLLPLANVTGGTAVGQVLRNTTGNVPAWGAVDLADTDAVTGLLPGTNVDPNFGTQNITSTGDFLLGATPASTGDMRVNHGFTLNGRDNANAGDNALIRYGVTLANELRLGNGGGTLAVDILGSTINLNAITSVVMTTGASGFTRDLISANDLGSNRKVIGLNSNVTTTQMPANTGDGVIFMGVRATAPTAAPVSGLIMYSTSNGELVTVSTDATTLNMKLGDGSNGVEIRSGGPTDDSIKLITAAGSGGSARNIVYLTNGILDFDSASLAAGSRVDFRYRGVTYMSMGRAGTTPQWSVFNATPVIQAEDPGALAASFGTADGVIADVGTTFNQATLNNNFQDLATKYNALRTLIRGYGLAA